MSCLEEIIDENGTNVYVVRKWLKKKKANHLFEELQKNIPWIQRKSTKFNWVEPRLSYIVGEPKDSKEKKIVHIYSGIKTSITSWDDEDNPLPHILEIRKLRDRIEEETGFFFDSASLQLYRDGNDYIAHHPDKELKPDYSRKHRMVDNVSIYCLSLGQTRDFHLKEQNGEKRLFTTEVRNGDIMVMSGKCQEDYKHSVPRRTAKNTEIGPRISITWRLLGDWE